MMQNKSSRLRLVIILGLIIISGLALWLALRGGSNPGDGASEYIDKDTGETISVQPGITPEKAGDNEQVTVIGLSSMARYGSASLSEAQLPVFRKDLAEKAVTKLVDHDQIIKIVNPALNPETVVFEAELIYKEGVATAKLTFDIPDNFVFSYEVWINGSVVYRSGKLVAGGGGEIPPESH